jgi:nucleoside-diphosphate-sugar epimerase
VTRSVFIFGAGFVGAAFARKMVARGWRVAATARSAEAREVLVAEGVRPVDPASAEAIARAIAGVAAVLITAAPDETGCPALAALGPALRRGGRPPVWIGYLSTTGVYGDRQGGWVTEDSPLAPLSEPARRRVVAEKAWRDLGAAIGAPVHIFRLPGIYGPGRSAFDRLRDGTARRIVRPGQVFSRIHRDDIVSALAASLARGGEGHVFNLCDDEPCPPQDVITYAATLLGVPPPPEAAYDAEAMSPASRRFYAESKRVSNARAKAALGWRPAFVSYREGLAAILAAEGS